ncbi:rhodanese-like domain-containing protein [Aestuariibacter halophilus]|uniref:Rhodanese-like domain-containing protein n=1 Tax=Fluctibacter halophilus TaxID=226011 RepID=A0ABS8G331_9ALTE|nr:rhodanese-like domain-containing protein [Aestuariibacter halophilus]MCC2614935.1 rhodanese-like domain-containing protein [Aestuariibacter halophilus]
MASPVLRTPPAPSSLACEHFAQLLAFETDCWDTHFAISNDRQDFVLLDVRAEALFQQGHLPGAVNIPHKRLNQQSLAAYDTNTVFVVYCAGPHCNGADKAALAISQLGRPVKKMIGGVTGWLDEGFSLLTD